MAFKRVFITAEAGVNHNGDFTLAKNLILEAFQTGADAIKFQSYITGNYVCEDAKKAEYQLKNTSSVESQFNMLKKLELSQEQQIELISYAKQVGISIYFTPFDISSVYFLNAIGMKIYKIPSGEITNTPYLRSIGKLNQKVIISCGMANLGELEFALSILLSSGTSINNITVMHANTEYPTPFEDVNLKAMATIRNAFGVDVGYSDHTLGIEVCIAAVALGALAIEKHITLSRKLPGPDHCASIEPHEFKAMVNCIRNIEMAIGDGIKRTSKSEAKNKSIARKSIVASEKIEKGDLLSEKNLTAKRPGDGLSPMHWDLVIGTKATKTYQKDEKIELQN